MAQSRKRRVELYFVLYLVALVLLLPDKPLPLGTSVSVPSDLRLDLQPERVRLECQLIKDTAGGLRLRKLDSENVIRYSGDVSDLQFRARVEDVASGQVLTIEAGSSPSALFELIAQPERQAVVFRWKPDLRDPVARTFRVTVLGSAMPPSLGGPNANDANALPSGLRINGSTQFVLATVVTDETGAPFQPGRTITDTLRIIQQDGGALGSFWMEAARDVLTSAPLQQWRMRLSIGGADPLRDLQGLPQVRATSSDALVERYLDTAARTIVIKGRAPRTGSYSVTVSARRKDGQLAETTFMVQAIALQGVQIAEVMYPGIEYIIDPRLPELANTEAVLLDGSREVMSVRSGKMRFTPKLSDTGRTLTFVRMIDDERVESATSISIRSFPAPEIRDVKDFGSGDRKKVIVKFYGDRNKDRPSLEVIDGNARSPRKLYGNIHPANSDDANGYAWIEEFEVSRKDGSKPFTFVVQAMSPTGKKSALWKE